MKKFIFVIIALAYTLLPAQSNDIQIEKLDFKFGFTIEVPFVLYNALNTNTGVAKTETHRMLGLHLSGRIILNNFAFEFRPGFVYSNNAHYYGVECGAYIRYMFSNSCLYLVGGLNIHNNFGVGNNRPTVISHTFILPNISVGCQLSEILGVFISYYHPLEKYKFFSETKWGEGGMMDGEYHIYSESLIGVLTIGVDWTF